MITSFVLKFVSSLAMFSLANTSFSLATVSLDISSCDRVASFVFMLFVSNSISLAASSVSVVFEDTSCALTPLIESSTKNRISKITNFLFLKIIFPPF